GAATGLGISTAAGSQSNPSIAFDGTNYFVAWDDSRGSSIDIYGTRVSPAGSIVDGATTGIAISTAAGNQTTPAVSFDGTNNRVVWADHRGTTNDVFGARVNKAGSVLDAVATGVAVSTAAANQSAPAIASDGTNSLVVWDDTRSPLTAPDVFGARLSNGGSVLDGAARGIAIAVVRASQSVPSVAFDGTNYLVVWNEARGASDSQVVAARVSQSGTLLDPAGIDLSVSVLLQKSPKVAFDGTNFLVVWDEVRSPATIDIRGTRVSPGGIVLDPGILNITTLPGFTNQETQPALAFDGTNYFVAWSDTRNGLMNSDIFGTRVSPAGTVLDGTATGIPISTAANNQTQPAIAFDGTNYLVTWSDNRSGDANIYGTRVSPAGTVVDGAATGFAISTAASAQNDSDLAFNGTNYLVAWLDLRSGDWDIFGARVSPAGSVLDGVASGIPISTVPQQQDSPAVAFNGAFLVTWRDRRSGKNFDLFGARVGNDGVVQDSSGFAVSAKPTNEGSGAVIAGTGNTWVSFYSRFESVWGVDQIFSRSIAPK
ncbi:MAG: hypothetical protein QOI55_919, partial [Actinomycetota bacterium]|nr:hypothetical protein [Actinomycetota bacterium]